METLAYPSALPTQSSNPSTAARVTGRTLTGLIIAFMTLDGAMKIIPNQTVIEATTRLGLSRESVVGIGITALVSTLLYALPRTAVLGATLLTAFFGGAVATQILAHEPTFNRVFPILFGVLTWLALYLRNPSVRTLTPIATVS